MPTFVVRLMNGEPLRQDAHHFEVDDKQGRSVFYKTETEVDADLLLFKHGVISITPAPEVAGMGLMLGKAKSKQP